jgi:hypothetical protein
MMMDHQDFDRAFVEGFGDELPDTVDEASVERMRAVAKLLDEQVEVPGTGFRVGIDPMVSAVPVVGDAVGAALSLYVVAEAAYLGVSFLTVLRMLANVAVDAVGGSIPYVGVVFDVFWKANKRNLELALDDLVEGAESSVSAVADAAGSARGGHGRGESDASEDDDRPVVIEVE